MPIYEYRCENGHTFEAFQPMSEDALSDCEVCDAPASRVLSAPAVHFKGSGFYTTDYARKGAKRGAGEDGGSGSKESKDANDGASKSDGKSSDGAAKKSEKAGSGSSSKSSE